MEEEAPACGVRRTCGVVRGQQQDQSNRPQREDTVGPSLQEAHRATIGTVVACQEQGLTGKGLEGTFTF